MIRARAIAYALWYGLLPWWCYERACHYASMSYSAHLRLNLRYAGRWVMGQEDDDDRAFERDTNRNPA